MALRFLPILMAILCVALPSLGLAGRSEMSLLFSVTLPLALLGIAAAIWDNSHPRYQLINKSGSSGPLNPPDLVSKS